MRAHHRKQLMTIDADRPRNRLDRCSGQEVDHCIDGGRGLAQAQRRWLIRAEHRRRSIGTIDHLVATGAGGAADRDSAAREAGKVVRADSDGLFRRDRLTRRAPSGLARRVHPGMSLLVARAGRHRGQVFTGGSPGDQRSVRNFLAELRRFGLAL